MSELHSLTQRNIGDKGASKNNKEILNLEFLEYFSEKLNEIFKFKDLIEYYP